MKRRSEKVNEYEVKVDGVRMVVERMVNDRKVIEKVIVTGKQIGRASCRERVYVLV